MKTLTLISILFVTYVSSVTCSANEFSWKNLMLAEAQLDPDYDFEANASWYMKMYRPNVWKRSKNNEFTFHGEIQKTAEIFKKQAKELDLKDTFTIKSNLTLGKYNFKTNSFPITPNGSETYWKKYRPIYASDAVREYRVFMQNHELLKEIKVKFDEAQKLIESRTGRYGDVDRRVWIELKIKIIKRRSERGQLLGVVEKATFYQDRMYSLALQTIEAKKENESENEVNPDKK